MYDKKDFINILAFCTYLYVQKNMKNTYKYVLHNKKESIRFVKQTFKQVRMKNLKLLFRLLLLLLLISCEKEETLPTTTQNQQYTVKNVSKEEITTKPLVLEKIKQFQNKIQTTTNKNTYLSEIDSYIDTNSAKYIENTTTGDHSYIFPVFGYNTNNNNLKNLVIDYIGDNQYDVYLVEYPFTEQEYPTLNIRQLSQRQTKFYKIELDGSTLLQNNVQNKTISTPYQICIEVWEQVLIPNNQGDNIGGEPIYEWGEFLIASQCQIVGGGSGSGNGGSTGTGGNTSGTGGSAGSNTGTPYTGYNPIVTTVTTTNEGIINGNLITNFIDQLNYSEKIWWNTTATSQQKTDIITYLLDNKTADNTINNEALLFVNELIKFLTLNTVNGVINSTTTQVYEDVFSYLNQQYSDTKLAVLLLNLKSEDIPWTSNSGNFNDIPSLHYTGTRTTLYNGQNCYQYRLGNGDFLVQINYSTSWQEQDIRTYYYSQPLKGWYLIPEPSPSSNYNHLDLDFLFNGIWSAVQIGVRYCTPLEDAIILIEGEDFDGVSQSRALAGIFILVDLVPGGKILKITKKAGYTLNAANPIVKRIITVTPLYKAQRAIKEEFKFMISGMSSLRKGNFGEICTDLDFYEKGYELLHINKVNSIDQTIETGIDHIFKNPITGEFIIVESKFHGTGGLSTLVDGTRQMSDTWISNGLKDNDDRLWKAVGEDVNLYNQIKPSLTTNNYTRIIAYVQPNGTINYKYITSQGYEINTPDGLFTN